MASSVVYSKADVYITPCTTGKRCQLKLDDLSKLLTLKGITCLNKHPVGGKFSKHFRDAFGSCQFTIIHKCRQMWELIHEFEEVFQEDEKVITVILFEDLKRKQGNKDVNKEGSFYKFFKTFPPHDMTNKKSIDNFVKELASSLLNSFRSTDSGGLNQLPSDHSLVSEQTVGLSEDDGLQATEKKGHFTEYPNLLEHDILSTIHVRKNYLIFLPKEELLTFADSNAVECTKFLEGTVKEDITKQILYQVLPDCCKTQNVMGLTCIACCDNPVLQDKASAQLALILLNREDEERPLSIAAMMESLLYGTLERKETDDDKTVSLACLYVMVVSDMILSTKKKGMCQTHLSTVKARSSRNKIGGTLHDLKKFIQNTSTKAQLMKQASDFFLLYTDENGKALNLENNAATQIIALYAALKKLFKSRNVKILHFLRGYLKHKNLQTSGSRYDLSSIMLVWGLTLFLTIGIKKADHQPLNEVCEEAVNIVNMFPDKNLNEELKNFRKMLYFVNNPKIREKIIHMKVTQPNSQKESSEEPNPMAHNYNKNQLSILMTHLQWILTPLFNVDKEQTLGQGKEGEWATVSGKFDNQDVLVHVHCPPHSDHQKKNKTEFKKSEDVRYNEMTILKSLQHRNIVTLIAYHEKTVPQFYVTENNRKTNLQTSLRYKREHQAFFDQTTLLHFLMNAASALEYCHSLNYVHCNLTCKSFFTVNDTSVKLSSFDLCLHLDKDGKARANGIKHLVHHVPTRWTAPEILNNDEFTNLSDVWMFGHLMYEILTHGLLPYHEEAPDETVANLIIKKEIKLTRRKNMKKDHFDLIYKCIHYEPEDRPKMDFIKEEMERLYEESKKSPKQESDDYSTNFKPSTEHQKGIPDAYPLRGADFQGKVTLFSLSDTVTMFKSDNQCTIREKIVHQDLRQLLSRDFDNLKDIFPYAKIIVDKETDNIDCEIPCSNKGSLEEVARGKTLGESLKGYMECILQVALVMKALHEKSWVLGDLCASKIYVEQDNGKIKVYVVSLTYSRPLKAKYTDSSPEDNQVCERAAPEVKNGGIFSPESDVYCFGNFMWEVVNYLAVEDTVTVNGRVPEVIGELWKTTHRKPSGCPDDVYELVKRCVRSSEYERIEMSLLTDELKRICEHLSGSSIQGREIPLSRGISFENASSI